MLSGSILPGQLGTRAERQIQKDISRVWYHRMKMGNLGQVGVRTGIRKHCGEGVAPVPSGERIAKKWTG